MNKNKIHIDEIIVFILFSTMCIISFLNVISRFLFHYSFAFTEEICINIFVYIVILGIGMAYTNKVHPAFNSVKKLFSYKIQNFILFASAVLTGLLLIVINFFIINMIIDEIYIFKSTSSGLGIAKWLYYIPIPFCTLLSLKRIWKL